MFFSNVYKTIKAIKTHFWLLCLSICVYFPNLSAQGWERTYGGILDDFATTALPISNGNYLVKGLSLNAFGNGSKSAFILKINSNGTLIWEKFIPCDVENGPIVSCPNETYITVVDLKVGLYTRPVFVKFDDNGNTLWEQFISLGGGISIHVNSIIPQPDGSILFAAESEEDAQFTSYIGKFDDQGNLLYLNELTSEIRSNTIVTHDSSSYTLMGPLNNDILSFWTVDETGNLLSTKSYDDMPNADFVYWMDNEELIFFEVNTLWIKQGRIDANGNLLDVKTIWEGFSFDLSNPPTRLDDGFISAGFVKSQSGTPPHRLGLIKTDLAGNVEWTQVPDYFLGVQIGQQAIPAHDDGFLISAYQRIGGAPTDARVYKTDAYGRIYSNAISGTVAIDSSLNCLVDPAEQRLEDWMVIAERADRSFTTTTDVDGRYLLPLDSGNYHLTIQPINPYWESCVNNLEVSFPGFDLSETIDLPVQAFIECPNMVISSGTPSLRPCFVRGNYISYCNNGTVTAEGAYIDITYDSLITPVSSSIPWDSLANNTYRFQLGDLAPLDCGTFSVGLFLDCEATTGAAYCIEARAFPDTICLPTSPSWNGAFLELTGTCQEDTIFFQIKNIGNAPMNEFSEYIIVEDAILLSIDSVELGIGATQNIYLPSTGDTYTIMAEQVEDAPGDPYPLAVIEACGEDGDGTFSIGFSNQFPLNDLELNEDIDCVVATNSFDPNDKQAFPTGFGTEHYILPEANIEYLIRFQNTGTDTAFTVVIKDTLDPKLDIASFQSGSSSHPYDFSVSGEGILTFTFENIMLPDSNVNEAASHGFVDFKIRPRKEISPGTVIFNDAAIFFDFNEPIITNETFHTITENLLFITVGTTTHPQQSNIEVLIAPNPFIDQTTIEVKHHYSDEYRFELFDRTGRLVSSEKFDGPSFTFTRNAIPDGFYFYRLSAKDGFLNTGSIVIIQ